MFIPLLAVVLPKSLIEKRVVDAESTTLKDSLTGRGTASPYAELGIRSTCAYGDISAQHVEGLYGYLPKV